MASILDKDERAARRLLRRGKASVGEILKISFGEWPPRGLDINPYVVHSQEVTLRDYFERATAPRLRGRNRDTGIKKWWNRLKAIVGDMKHIWGVSNISSDRVIWINKLLCTVLPALKGESALVPTLGHEVIHTLQGDNCQRAGDVYGTHAFMLKREQPGMRSDFIMKQLKNYDARFSKGAMSEAFNATVKAGYINYLESGEETQAFLHEALAEGYKKWRRMPGNYAELWQSLISLGVPPTPFVEKYLRNHPAPAFATQVEDAMAARNLANLSLSLSPQGRDLFWIGALPGLYADLIEMYGDRPGRARFGLGHNIKADVQAATFGSDKMLRGSRGNYKGII